MPNDTLDEIEARWKHAFAPPDIRTLIKMARERDRVVDALRWAMPFAKMAIEEHRQCRLRAGHTFGTKMVGLYDDEVNEMWKHERTLAALDAPPAQEPTE